jgi:hypothetical protein
MTIVPAMTLEHRLENLLCALSQLASIVRR